MKNLNLIYTLILITISFSAHAQTSTPPEVVECTNEAVDIKVSGFLGYGAEAKKIKPLGKISTTVSDASTYEKSFEIGRYRFVKEEKWTIYRKDDEGNYVLRNDIQYPVRVSVDQPIYVSRRDQNSLEVRRNTDDVNSTSIMITFSSGQVDVKNAIGNKILTVKLCKAQNSRTGRNNPGSNPTQAPTEPNSRGGTQRINRGGVSTSN